MYAHLCKYIVYARARACMYVSISTVNLCACVDICVCVWYSAYTYLRFLILTFYKPVYLYFQAPYIPP